MSNLVPPLLSNSPPPIVGALDEEDDEFGDFAVAMDLSYGCDALSLPSSPKKPAKEANESISNHCNNGDTNCSQITNINASKSVEKDFQDRRKAGEPTSVDEVTDVVSESSVGQEIEADPSVNNLLYNTNKINVKLDMYNGFQYFPEMPPDILPENEEDEFADVEEHFVNECDDFHESSRSCENDTREVTSETNSYVHSQPSRQLANGTLADNNLEAEKADAIDSCNDLKSDENIDGQVMGALEDVNQSDTLASKDLEMRGTIISEEAKDENICSDSESFLNNDVHGYSNITCEEQPELSDNITTSEGILTKDNNLSTNDGEDEDLKLKNCSVVKDVHLEDVIGDSKGHLSKLAEEIATNDTIDQMKDDLSSKCCINDEAEDDFADFESVTMDLKLQVNYDPQEKTNVKDLKLQLEQDIQGKTNINEENFGDFSSFPSTSEQPIESKEVLKPLEDEDDDFGDFNDYSVESHSFLNTAEETEKDVPQLQRMLSIDIEAIPQKVQAIILEMFPVVEQSTEEYQPQDFTAKNPIFEGLKDITDTAALLYQWSKSNSQHFLLQALNIDTRNILYGPRWNESMPRYAATLGFTPLEPVKSEALAPTTAETFPTADTFPASSPPGPTPSSEAPQQADIPSAQFDWVGSGLTNPLEITPKKIVERQDSQFKEFKNSAPPLHAPPVSTRTVETDTKPTNFQFATFEPPEISTASQTQDSESVKSLQFNDEPPAEEVPSKVELASFDDFSSFQSPKNKEKTELPSWSFNNSIPLRETHISSHSDSSKVEKIGFEEPGWLKPTIVTPDLPRKEAVASELEEEDFTDFQASQPVSSNQAVPVQPPVEVVQRKDSDSRVSANVAPTNDDDDEFTDFQSTLPNLVSKPPCAPPEVLQPAPAMFQPLQPCVLQPIVSTNAPAVINWPDPGITDADLQHIQLNYQPMYAESDEVAEPRSKTGSIGADKPPDLAAAKRAASKESSKTEDDDDWSDFVSNQGPVQPTMISDNQQGLHKTTNQIRQPNSRTSTPELQLCIPQLNQIQIPKKPVPIITQEGLVQTKLSSNLPISIEPLVQPSVQHTSTYPQRSQLQNGFQPSLISNQFAQFGQGLMYPHSHLSIHQSNPMQKADAPKQIQPQYFPYSQPSRPPAAPISASRPDEHDDEWTDFVSSQPAPPPTQTGPSMISNGLPRSVPKPNFDWNRPPQFTSWSANVTPNIITNPVSFDSFQSYSPPAHSDLFKNRASSRKNPSVVVQPKKNTVPSISTVPDLEFIAPKNRTWKK